MSSLIRWNPFSDFDSFFDGAFKMPVLNNSKVAWDLAVDVFEDGGNVIAEMSVPGIDPKKVDISIDNNMLIISGAREEKTEKKTKHFFRREIHAGSFERRIFLPTEVDPNKASAEYKDGVLHISMPKKQAKGPDRVKVKVN